MAFNLLGLLEPSRATHLMSGFVEEIHKLSVMGLEQRPYRCCRLAVLTLSFTVVQECAKKTGLRVLQ